MTLLEKTYFCGLKLLTLVQLKYLDMKLSLSWLKEYINLDHLPVSEISEMLTDLGLEVEGIEEVETIKGGLKGIVIGQVVECGQHPNADSLSVTKVDVGQGELLPIVCGAPNVAKGQKVVVATVGTTLYGEDDKPFLIKKAKLRGEPSHGMICAEDELGLGDSHEGIMVLPDDVKVGTEAASYFDVETDIVFEIGLTPNRADGNSHIGAAKDLATKLSYDSGKKISVAWPDIEAFDALQNQPKPSPISVEIKNIEACPRYAGLYISGVSITSSPEWMQRRLISVGVRPINNIVDITNFVLHELGQPLHAFDADKIAGHKIIVNTLEKDTPFEALDEVTRKLRAEDLMICDVHEQGICMAGVFGGANSGVTENTTNIFLESAYFEPAYIRPSSFKHDLRTDAAKCFEKGVDINRIIPALKRAALLIKEYGGGDINFQIVDEYPRVKPAAIVDLNYDKVRSLIGANIPNSEMDHIMEAMDFVLTEKTDTTVRVQVTTDKPDVTRPADIVEEILRVYNYNNVPTPAKVNASPAYGKFPEPHYLQELVANYLADNGFLEAMGLSITQSKYFAQALPVADEELVYINNTSNMHLDVMRPYMLPAMLEAIERSQNRQTTDLKYFEFGKTYRKKEKGYSERKHLTLTLTGKTKPQNWHGDQKETSFYTIKAYVDNVLRKLGIDSFRQNTPKDNFFAFGTRYEKGPMKLVEFGRLTAKITKAFSVKGEVYYADFDWDVLLKLATNRVKYSELNKFPGVRRDLALVIDKKVKFGDIALLVNKTLKDKVTDINLFDVYENDEQLGPDKKSYAISLTIEDKTKTLKDKEVEAMMNKVVKTLQNKVGAVLR